MPAVRSGAAVIGLLVFLAAAGLMSGLWFALGFAVGAAWAGRRERRRQAVLLELTRSTRDALQEMAAGVGTGE